MKDIDSRRQHMNIINRCHFELKGGAKFDALVSRIIEYVDSLLKICSEAQAEVYELSIHRWDHLLTPMQKIERALLNQISISDDSTQLMSMGKVYGEEAARKRKAGQRYSGYELIKDVANYKARIRSLAIQRSQETQKRQSSSTNAKSFLLSNRFLDEQDYEYGADRWKFTNGRSSLAIKKQAHVMYYIVGTIGRSVYCIRSVNEITGMEIICRS